MRIVKKKRDLPHGPRIEKFREEWTLFCTKDFKLKTLEYSGYTLTYYNDHDKRYAHIPEEERWKYPDEIKGYGLGPCARENTLAEIEERGVDTRWGHASPSMLTWSERLLLSKDVPITEAFESIIWYSDYC